MPYLMEKLGKESKELDNVVGGIAMSIMQEYSGIKRSLGEPLYNILCEYLKANNLGFDMVYSTSHWNKFEKWLKGSGAIDHILPMLQKYKGYKTLVANMRLEELRYAENLCMQNARYWNDDITTRWMQGKLNSNIFILYVKEKLADERAF